MTEAQLNALGIDKESMLGRKASMPERYDAQKGAREKTPAENVGLKPGWATDKAGDAGSREARTAREVALAGDGEVDRRTKAASVDGLVAGNIPGKFIDPDADGAAAVYSALEKDSASSANTDVGAKGPDFQNIPAGFRQAELEAYNAKSGLGGKLGDASVDPQGELGGVSDEDLVHKSFDFDTLGTIDAPQPETSTQLSEAELRRQLDEARAETAALRRELDDLKAAKAQKEQEKNDVRSQLEAELAAQLAQQAGLRAEINELRTDGLGVDDAEAVGVAAGASTGTEAGEASSETAPKSEHEALNNLLAAAEAAVADFNKRYPDFDNMRKLLREHAPEDDTPEMDEKIQDAIDAWVTTRKSKRMLGRAILMGQAVVAEPLPEDKDEALTKKVAAYAILSSQLSDFSGEVDGFDQALDQLGLKAPATIAAEGDAPVDAAAGTETQTDDDLAAAEAAAAAALAGVGGADETRVGAVDNEAANPVGGASDLPPVVGETGGPHVDGEEVDPANPTAVEQSNRRRLEGLRSPRAKKIYKWLGIAAAFGGGVAMGWQLTSQGHGSAAMLGGAGGAVLGGLAAGSEYISRFLQTRADRRTEGRLKNLFEGGSRLFGRLSNRARERYIGALVAAFGGGMVVGSLAERGYDMATPDVVSDPGPIGNDEGAKIDPNGPDAGATGPIGNDEGAKFGPNGPDESDKAFRAIRTPHEGQTVPSGQGGGDGSADADLSGLDGSDDGGGQATHIDTDDSGKQGTVDNQATPGTERPPQFDYSSTYEVDSPEGLWGELAGGEYAGQVDQGVTDAAKDIAQMGNQLAHPEEDWTRAWNQLSPGDRTFALGSAGNLVEMGQQLPEGLRGVLPDQDTVRRIIGLSQNGLPADAPQAVSEIWTAIRSGAEGNGAQLALKHPAAVQEFLNYLDTLPK